MTVLILVIMVIYVTMVYGPIAAFLVELFPTRIRYSSMSLPYHIGNGWFGGLLPLIAAAMVVTTGNIYYGLWYPIVVAIMTFVVARLPDDNKNRDIRPVTHSTPSLTLLRPHAAPTRIGQAPSPKVRAVYFPLSAVMQAVHMRAVQPRRPRE